MDDDEIEAAVARGHLEAVVTGDAVVDVGSIPYVSQPRF